MGADQLSAPEGEARGSKTHTGPAALRTPRVASTHGPAPATSTTNVDAYAGPALANTDGRQLKLARCPVRFDDPRTTPRTPIEGCTHERPTVYGNSASTRPGVA